MTTPTKKIVAHGAFGPGQGESSYEYLRLDEDYRALQGGLQGLAAQVEELTKERDELQRVADKLKEGRNNWKNSATQLMSNIKSTNNTNARLTKERNTYQQAADNTAASHKIERDALAAAAKLALEALKLIRRQLKAWEEGDSAIAALKQAGVQ